MDDIRLDDGTIRFGSEWMTAEQLTERIQKQMDAGNLKFAELANALERLKKALEDAKTLELRLVLPKSEYEDLKSKGGDDDRESIRKAIRFFIEKEENAGKPKKRVVKCANCQSPIEIPAGEKPDEIRCPKCNAVGRRKSK